MRIFVRIECFMGVVSNTHIDGNIMFVIAYDLNIFSLVALANGVPILLTNSSVHLQRHAHIQMTCGPGDNDSVLAL